ncbi:MAG TPA: hypothetical protein VH079_12345 [Terriglobales bacterium]|jgi:hypothetical protein|nr:hypothetical protein [Terriglobales bacterium]
MNNERTAWRQGKISILGIIAILFCQVLLGLISIPCGAQNNDPPKSPIATIAVGWTYLYADQGNDERVSLNGWFARPSVTIGKGFSGFADFTNYYGANHKGSINSHGFTFGVSKEIFTSPRIKPAIFAEAGDVRASNAGSIVNQFAFATGASFAIPLRKWVSLAITPAEWVFLDPKGDPRNDFNSKIGFSFPIGKR